MIYRALGQTGLQVSILGFGAAPLGNVYGDIDPHEGVRAVHRALELGVNYFDVAPFYGRTLAETRLGAALRGRRESVILATKVGRHDEDPRSGFDFSAPGVARSLEASLNRLRTDYVDVLLAHDIEFAPLEQIVHETIPAMRRLQEQGKTRFVGVTGYPLHMLRRVIMATPIDVVLSYSRYNLCDVSMDDVLTPVAKQLGVGLINASPLHMGALTNMGAPAWHPAPAPVLAATRRAAAYCRQHGADISGLALQFALAHPHVAMTLVGMSTIAEVETNVRAVGAAPDPALLAAVQAILRPVANIWWDEGLPENFDPGGVKQQAPSLEPRPGNAQPPP